MSTTALAGAPRALPPGQLPNDRRLASPKDLNGDFPFAPPTSSEAWRQRAEQVRRQILVSQGLWPEPTRTPLNPVIHGRRDMGDYTVEKVYFESMPGFFVTGNLYRPKTVSGKVPAVLFAHGHWTDARLSETPPEELRREIATGAERFEIGGRSRFQSLCVQAARMGCVVWQWDMLGNSDCQQISMEIAHRFAKQRPEMNTPENWGLYSPQAEAHLQSVMGLQTWNAIRSVDFVLGLPEVDPQRIAVTGASGGGTQSMLLGAVDPRVALSFPAVMVSTSMQGGCTCENACLLRVDTGNVEFAALFAPKPQGLTTANDWTREMATKGFPDLKKVYTLMGAPDAVMLHRGEHFPHNYNAVARSAFYTWLNRHFRLGQTEPVIERDYPFIPPAELSVWDAQHPAPQRDDAEFERGLLRWWAQDSQARLASLPVEESQGVGRAAWETLIGRSLSQVGEQSYEQTSKTDRGTWLEITGVLANRTQGEELPAVFCHPKEWSGTTVVWLTGEGKDGLYGPDGRLKPDVQALVDAGATVASADLLYQGEFMRDGRPLTQAPKVKETRESAAYTLGYNASVFAQRVRDVVSLVQFIQGHERQSKRVVLVGMAGAGPWVAAARVLCGDAVSEAVVDTGGFRFAKLLDYRDPNFLPGGAKYGDLPGLLALAAPGRTLVLGETADALGPVRSRYAEKNADGALRAVSAGESVSVKTWLGY
jgi:dienelactone hydrolase